ncbi:HipA domain-containing protein [Bradyrhizobium sp. USDA 4354]
MLRATTGRPLRTCIDACYRARRHDYLDYYKTLVRAWRPGHFSLAGAAEDGLTLRRKAVGRTERPPGHILQEPMPHLRGTTEKQYACLRLANHLGITAAEAKVGKFGEEVASSSPGTTARSKDRLARRFHQEEMCQALGVHPAVKYQSEGGPSGLRAVPAIQSGRRSIRDDRS